MVEWLTLHSMWANILLNHCHQLWQWLNGGVVDLYEHMQHILRNSLQLEFKSYRQWFNGEVVDPSQYEEKHFTQPL